MTINYKQLLEEQRTHRKAFGDMVRRWRMANAFRFWAWDYVLGPYLLLEEIEAGTAGELQQEAFFALADLNQHPDIISLGDWDGETTRWTAVEFWACYCGLRPVPGRWTKE